MESLIFQHQAILAPVLAMLALMMIVWHVMFAIRFKVIGAKNIDPAAMSTPEAVNKLMPAYATGPSNNFKNLFEVPMLFFVLCFYLFISRQVDDTYVYLAWGFVTFRYLHSLIHCSYNNVNHRFGAYALACLALWAMLVRAILAAL